MMTIVKKELLDHLQSIQFAVLLCVTVVLFCGNGLIFSKRFNQQSTWYTRKVTEAVQNQSTVSQLLYVRPDPLLFISESGNHYRPSGYELKPRGALAPMPSEPRNYKMPDIPELDWAFIIKVLFSLFVVLLGYNSISGEKEQGTLRQILSQPMGRIRLLIAKHAAIVLTVAVPLIIGALMSLIIVGMSIPTVPGVSTISSLVLMIFLALIYLSIFAFLSLLISSLIRQSSLVLLTLLVVWVFFAVIVPNTSGIVAEQFSGVPSEYQEARQLGPMIQQQVWAKIEKIQEKASRGELTTEEQVKRACDRAFDEGQEDLIKHYDSYYNAMKQRVALARTISRLSPTALFQYASEGISETGTDREERFMRDAREYSRIYDEYILKKVGKLTGVSNFSFMGSFDVNGKTIMIRSPFPEEYRGDKSDFPRFVESRISVSDGIRSAMADGAGLIIWNLVLAVGAFSAIIRCDAR